MYKVVNTYFKDVLQDHLYVWLNKLQEQLIELHKANNSFGYY